MIFWFVSLRLITNVHLFSNRPYQVLLRQKSRVCYRVFCLLLHPVVYRVYIRLSNQRIYRQANRVIYLHCNRRFGPACFQVSNHLFYLRKCLQLIQVSNPPYRYVSFHMFSLYFDDIPDTYIFKNNQPSSEPTSLPSKSVSDSYWHMIFWFVSLRLITNVHLFSHQSYQVLGQPRRQPCPCWRGFMIPQVDLVGVINSGILTAGETIVILMESHVVKTK